MSLAQILAKKTVFVQALPKRMNKRSLKGGKMRIFKIVFVTVVLSIFFIAASSYGADVAKIGVVSFQKILEKSDAGKKATAEINKRGKEMEDSLKKKGEEIEAKKKKLEREALVMNKAAMKAATGPNYAKHKPWPYHYPTPAWL